MKQQILEIAKQQIKKIFDTMRGTMLTPDVAGYAIVFGLRDTTATGGAVKAYLDALTDNTLDPKQADPKTTAILQGRIKQLVDAAEQKHINDTVSSLSSAIDSYSITNDINDPKNKKSLVSQVKKILHESSIKIKRHADTIAETEIANAQNFGAYDGIIGASKSIGIEDPTVLKIMVRDESNCQSCKRLWLQPDGITPKVYKLSELQGISSDPKNPVPSVSVTHPNCRCHLVMLSPGFGFKDGKISFISPGHNEFNRQRNS